ncbi:unnamed protein product [Triticum turgidum subsp. durum]|uniref:Glycosyltransferase n=1 Tax=Triticum turgidum subsp. durum TaxID=4567 RepID=A0A9R1AVW7_TRITD|nr:unnamed protein product [Triticum turgidum subsp. durum]
MLADRSSDTYAGFLSLAKDAARVDGILVNTFPEVEPAVGQGGTDGVKDMPVHAVGPLVWTRPVATGVNREPEHARLITWLDQQPRGSVTAILAHAAVGCFVTHCGWNSSLESILNGVPMVAWPLYAEQKMNAAMLEAHSGVAARLNAAGPGNGDGFVCKEEIVSVIRRVMDGDEATTMRMRAGELRDRATHALAMDGSSTLALAKVTALWKSSTSSDEK